MQESDYEQFAICWDQACVGAGKSPDPKAIEWAFEVLRDFAIDDVKRGLIMHARNPESGQFLPKPADVIRQIKGTRADRKDLAIAAFASVLENINRYSTVVFDDQAIHYAIQIAFGNWQKVADFNEDDFACQEQRRSFISAYSTFKPGLPYPPTLIGLTEQSNSAEGKSNPLATITYVGDKQKALTVERGGRSGGMALMDVDSIPAIEAMA